MILWALVHACALIAYFIFAIALCEVFLNIGKRSIRNI